MASIETIMKRIEGKRNEISKLESKIARIEKAKASNWQNNPYYYHESDLIRTNKELDSARVQLTDYERKLIAEQEKAASRNVPAILEFLEGWKERVFQYYHAGLVECYELYEAYRKAGQELNKCHYGTQEYKDADVVYKAAWKVYREKTNGYYHEEEYVNKFGRTCTKNVKDRDGELEYLGRYKEYRTIEEAETKLKSDLEKDAAAKYDDIVERTNYIVGTIEDASKLRVGAKGELNGFVIGSKGIAKVETIGAGGYNIQCFHFRTLIHKVNEVYNF